MLYGLGVVRTQRWGAVKEIRRGHPGRVTYPQLARYPKAKRHKESTGLEAQKLLTPPSHEPTNRGLGS